LEYASLVMSFKYLFLW